MPSPRTIAIVGLVALLAGGALWPLLRRASERPEARAGGLGAHAASAGAPAELPVVRVAPVVAGSMRRTERLVGTLKSGSEATLSAKQGGRIAEVRVAEGARVRRGEALVLLDAADAQRQAEAARAGVAAARAAWEKALRGERLKREEIERRIREARRGVEQARLRVEQAEAGVRLRARAAQAEIERAEAGVAAARSALAQAKEGARPEQRRQAEIQLRQAERGAERARRNLEDVEFLYQRGGVPRAELEEAQEGYRKAQDGVAQARAQWELLQAGASPAEIAAAEAQLRSAEAGLAAARAAADREALDSAEVRAARAGLAQAEDGLRAALAGRAELEVARADVRAARAAYEQALASARLAEQQVAAAVLVSPLDGIAVTVSARPGEMAGPGMPLVRIVSAAGAYLEAAAAASRLAALRPGAEATIEVDALPGRTFQGVVRSVGAAAGPDGRSYPVRIDFVEPPAGLRPGGVARAEVVTEALPEALTVPIEALRSPEETEADSEADSASGAERALLWIVREGRIVEVPVTVPLQRGGRAAVLGTLRAGESVVLAAPAGLRPGDAVRTEAAPP